jgi:hypothetical protein
MTKARTKPTQTYIYRLRSQSKIRGCIVANDLADLYKQIEREHKVEDFEYAILAAPASLRFQTEVEETDDEEWEIKTIIRASLPHTGVRWQTFERLCGGKRKFDALVKEHYIGW